MYFPHCSLQEVFYILETESDIPFTCFCGKCHLSTDFDSLLCDCLDFLFCFLFFHGQLYCFITSLLVSVVVCSQLLSELLQNSRAFFSSPQEVCTTLMTENRGTLHQKPWQKKITQSFKIITFTDPAQKMRKNRGYEDTTTAFKQINRK